MKNGDKKADWIRRAVLAEIEARNWKRKAEELYGENVLLFSELKKEKARAVKPSALDNLFKLGAKK